MKPKIKIGNKILKWLEPPPRFWTKGKFYSELIDSGKLKMKYVYFPPGFEGAIHSHKGQNMKECHFIISGSGKWEWYDKNRKKVIKSGKLEAGKFSPMFDDNTPDHQFISNPRKPLFFLAIEWYKKG